MAEILEVAIDGALKTQLMYRANLSFAQLNEYIKILVDLGLLSIDNNSQRTVYRTTQKGMRYLQSYREIKDLLKKERHSVPNGNNGNNGNGVFLVKRGSNVICSKGPF
jgi:predicted transcriptional regulator